MDYYIQIHILEFLGYQSKFKKRCRAITNQNRLCKNKISISHYCCLHYKFLNLNYHQDLNDFIYKYLHSKF